MSVGQHADVVHQDDRIPDELRVRMVMHGQETPYHRRVQDRLRKEDGMEYADIRTWDELRTVFDYLDDDNLRGTPAADLVPEFYEDDQLVLSTSSGTTGEPKEVYWHVDDVERNIDYIESVLRDQGVPDNEYWVGTVTPNEVLRLSMEELAERFDADYTIVEVDPQPIKQALRSGDENRVKQAFHTIAQDLIPLFEAYDVGVYEDIAPSMNAVGQLLSEEQQEQVETLLIGGVGTTQPVVDRLTTDVFNNATLSGWYGDYMTGSNMMRSPGTLEYVPDEPEVRLDVQDTADEELVAPGEQGEVVLTTIRQGFFVPNRRIGDVATRSVVGGVNTVADIGRLEG